MEKDEELEFFDRFGFLKGKEKRSVIHNSGLWHKGVHVWVFNESGELFLKKRALDKKFFPGHWEDVGEHLKPGESYKEAAERGLREELGVNGVELKKLANAKMCFPEKNCGLIELWKCKFKGKIKENKKEGFNGGFFSIREIEGLFKERKKITPWFKELFYWYLKEKKNE